MATGDHRIEFSTAASSSEGTGPIGPFSGSISLGRSGGGNGGDRDDTRIEGLEFRVSRLEDDVRRMEGKLDAIGDKLSELLGRVSSLPTATEFGAVRNDIGRVEGRVRELPTWPKLIWAIVLLGGMGAGLASLTEVLIRLWLSGGAS